MPLCPVSARKCAISVDLPMPGSPVTKTTRRSPARALPAPAQHVQAGAASDEMRFPSLRSRLRRVRLQRRVDKPVAAAMYGGDVFRLLGAFAQGLANVQDAGFEHGFLDKRVRPDGLQQFLLGDDPARVLDQIRRDGISLRSELDALLSAPDVLIFRIQRE